MIVPPPYRPHTEEEAALALAWLGANGQVAHLALLREHTPLEIWRAGRRRLASWGMRPDPAARFVERRRLFAPEPLADCMVRKGVRFMPFTAPGYPLPLRHLSHPPAGLFVKSGPGVWPALLSAPRLTIVGTRKATAYGLSATMLIASAAAEAGIAIVSGMAFGIDAQSHSAALSKLGLTAAVLGSGVDLPSPRANQHLYDRMCLQGAVMSEMPPGTPPGPWSFPRRNRLLAALGDAVLVVEAGLRSGALITVGHAAELGRPVFAVPGPITSSQSRGTNQLIADGAIPVVDVQGMVEDFFAETRILRSSDPQALSHLPGTEESCCPPDARHAIESGLRAGPATPEELASKTGLGVRRTAQILSFMELEGKLARAGPGLFRLCP